ncbi:lactoylglutathione lyase [Devosia sp. Root685]|uniref:VOC family protein n=1 Tax=Devosia sp. Root685 TaxID=1736587 RepID=UPI0006FD5FE9|nr:VOC family protein [Devosia sp. Root685]KRB01328.1 lactoylglutathione lyase [Devosia sp. Root685]
MLLGFEHVGMTVSTIDRAVAFYCDLLGLKLVLRKVVDRGEIAFFDTGAGMLELFAPGANMVDRFRDVPNHEAGLRHITFAFSSVDETFAALEAAGVAVVERPRDAYNKEMIQRVAFVRDYDGILVELIERAEGRAS